MVKASPSAPSKASVHVIIVAAGSGSRYGAERPKQFCDMLGRPVLMHTIEGMRRAVPAASMTVVLAADMVDYWQGLCRTHGFDSPAIVTGGATRWQSVKNALTAVGAADIVLVHDGARPVVNAKVVGDIIDTAVSHRAAVPVLPVTDSLRRMTSAGASEAIDRSLLRVVQTPQGFDTQTLIQAYTRPWSPEFTDDASVVQAAGTVPALVAGDPHNIKITNPGDIAVATLFISS